MKKEFLNKAVRAIKADYFGYPLDEELGLIETIEGEIKRYLNEKFSITHKTSEEIRAEVLSIQEKLKDSLELLKRIKDSKKYEQLDSLLNLIYECHDLVRNSQVEEYLKNTSADNFFHDIEESVRKQIRTELDRNKNYKRLVNIIVWFATLIFGGLIGVVFQKIFQ